MPSPVRTTTTIATTTTTVAVSTPPSSSSSSSSSARKRKSYAVTDINIEPTPLASKVIDDDDDIDFKDEVITIPHKPSHIINNNPRKTKLTTHESYLIYSNIFEYSTICWMYIRLKVTTTIKIYIPEFSGQWILFPGQYVDPIWSQIKLMMINKLIGDTAKLANWGQIRVICIYSNQCDDVQDVFRILKSLVNEGILMKGKIYYKRDIDILNNIDSMSISGDDKKKGKTNNYYIGNIISSTKIEMLKTNFYDDQNDTYISKRVANFENNQSQYYD